MDVWGFLWIMLALKIPLGMLLWIVWWAVHAEVEDEAPQDDGGTKKTPERRPPPKPRRRRPRGPHGDPAPLPAPPRVRTVARGRSVEKRPAE
jgi:hypothetical protein